MRAYPGDEQDDCVHCTCHDRHIDDDIILGCFEKVVNIVSRLAELIYFVILAHVGLDDTDAGNILLNALIQCIIFLEYLAEILCRSLHDKKQDNSEKDDRNKIDRRDPGVDDKRHDHGNNHGKRCPDRHAQDHLVRILYICHIRRKSGDQTGCAELVDVRE